MADVPLMDEQQAFAEPHCLQWGDKALKLSMITQNVKKVMTAAFKAKVIAEFNELKELLVKDGKPDEQRIKEEWEGVKNSMLTGYCTWGGPLCNDWLVTAAGHRTLIENLLREGGTPLSSKEVTKLTRDKSMKDALSSTLEVILMESEAPN